ncbi:hypothetical protein [Acuticoccus mangrovi]|uniref:Uncharacterized protein n=1 Tax=Acuticoccus mangrovi TaxID=2796142 RepID=A0A934MCC9_9HYPH|nr:hypothetical protein [Acuticoccus mangrovi]MBJ3775137.1 hypothetical protein [Acuticoccus mangrovi]
MMKLFTAAALATVVSLGAVADASAFQRTRTTTGPAGNSATYNSSAQCAGGVCSRSATRSGAYGRSATTSGSASCAGGTCTHSSTTSGTYGNTVTRSGSVSRY